MALTLTPDEQPAPEGAAALAAPAPTAPQNQPVILTMTLEGIFKDWLLARARHYQQEPGEHVAAILRAYWAHHDAWRHGQAGAATARRVE